MCHRWIILAAIVVSITVSSSLAQSIKGNWQKADSLELIEDGVFAAASDQVAYYIGLDKGWKTTNGGAAWTQLAFPSEITVGPSRIFTFGSTVILLQQRADISVPMLVRSTDEGETWQIVNDSTIYDNLKSVTMWSPTGIHIISLDGGGSGRSYVSNDGGVTFDEGRTDSILQKYIATSLSGTKRYSIAAAWSDSLNGVISLSPRNIPNPTAHVLITHNAGASWKEVLLPNRNDTVPIPGNVYTLPGTPYFWVTVTDLMLPGCYYLSTDHGETWRVSAAVGRPLELLSPVDTSLVWGLFSAFTYRELNQNKTFVNQGLQSGWDQIMGIPAGGQSSRSIDYFKFFSPTEGWATGTRVNATGTLYYYIYRFMPQSSVATAPGNDALRLFPMPAAHTLKVQMTNDGPVKYQIADILGRKVSTEVKELARNNEELTLDVRGLPPGIYILLLTTKDGTQQKETFIKE